MNQNDRGVQIVAFFQYVPLLKSNEKILEEVEVEYKKFMEQVEKDRLAEIKRKQVEGQNF